MIYDWQIVRQYSIITFKIIFVNNVEGKGKGKNIKGKGKTSIIPVKL